MEEDEFGAGLLSQERFFIQMKVYAVDIKDAPRGQPSNGATHGPFRPRAGELRAAVPKFFLRDPKIKNFFIG